MPALPSVSFIAACSPTFVQVRFTPDAPGCHRVAAATAGLFTMVPGQTCSCLIYVTYLDYIVMYLMGPDTQTPDGTFFHTCTHYFPGPCTVVYA